jgi:hypothetical protein
MVLSMLIMNAAEMQMISVGHQRGPVSGRGGAASSCRITVTRPRHRSYRAAGRASKSHVGMVSYDARRVRRLCCRRSAQLAFPGTNLYAS